jgi:hypothetical protein
MTPKPTLPKEFLKDLKPSNKMWFEKYKAESDDRKKYYNSNIQEFLKFCAHNNDKEIVNLDKTDVDLYIATLRKYTDSPYTINHRISALSKLRNFLHTKYPDTFDEYFLSNLPRHKRKDEENPTDIRALSLEQLSYARQYNRRSIIDEYIFELFFQLRIDKNDLIARKFPKPRSASLDEIINKVSKDDVTESYINSYFSRVTIYLQKQDVYDKGRRKINSYDLSASHDAYIFRCPNCGRPFENIAKYWVLARVRLDDAAYQDEYRIVCDQCRGASTI